MTVSQWLEILGGAVTVISSITGLVIALRANTKSNGALSSASKAVGIVSRGRTSPPAQTGFKKTP